MGSADQARNLNSLLQMCNIRQKYDKYKHTQLPQILLSESYTSNYVAVLENDYVNLFDNALDRTMLINLSSGSEMETLLSCYACNKMTLLLQEFLQKCFLLPSKKLFDPIPRNINKSMMMRKKYIAKTNRLTTAKVKRDILGDHYVWQWKVVKLLTSRKC